MEQKKLLWIISGVGVFLLVILLTAMIVYKPAPMIATPIPVEKTEQESGWIKPEETTKLPVESDLGEIVSEVTPEEPETSDSVNVSDLFVVSDKTNVITLGETNADGSTTIDLNAFREAHKTTETQQQNINITVNIPEAEVKTTTSEPANVTVNTPVNTPAKTEPVVTKTEPVIDYSKGAVAAEKAEKEASTKKSVSTETKPATVTSNTTTVSKPAATTTTTKPATTTAKQTTSTTSTTTVTTRYWVQVASYSTKKAAESARDILQNNKINADIFTYQDSTGTIYFRVRVGPYTTKSEAEYWMNKIIEIKDFAKSGAYVTKTTN
ncbi:MAG: SPOR domain-containing protein [Treponema sp.]|nr:SPOR domain-containing protein [Treponema sp.]